MESPFFLPRFEPFRTCRAASHSTRPTFTKPRSCAGDPWIVGYPQWNSGGDIYGSENAANNEIFIGTNQENGHVIPKSSFCSPLNGPRLSCFESSFFGRHCRATVLTDPAVIYHSLSWSTMVAHGPKLFGWQHLVVRHRWGNKHVDTLPAALAQVHFEFPHPAFKRMWVHRYHPNSLFGM